MDIKKILYKNDKGFTLVELIVVIMIIAILGVALAPQVMKYINKSRISTDLSNAVSLQTALSTAYTDYCSTYSGRPSMTGVGKIKGDGTYDTGSATLGGIAEKFNEIVAPDGKYPKTKYTTTGFELYYNADGVVYVTCGAM